MTRPVPAGDILRGALARDMTPLAIVSGVSAPRLTQMALRLLDDPETWAAHPIECRLLAERRDRERVGRSARNLGAPTPQV